MPRGERQDDRLNEIARKMRSNDDPASSIVEIAKAARDAHIPFAAFARGLSLHPRRIPAEEHPVAGELKAFVTSLALEPSCKMLLEVGEEDFLFAEAASTRADLDIVCMTRSPHLADCVAAYGLPAAVMVRTASSEIDPTRRFDLIVAHLPWGTQPSREQGADGYGGEAMAALAPLLAGSGRIVWITSRGALSDKLAKQGRREWASKGFLLQATVDLPVGWATHGAVEGVAFVMARSSPGRRLIATLRDPGSGLAVATALSRGPSKNPMSCGRWVEDDASETYSEHERRQAIAKLMPRGRYHRVPLKDLMVDGKWERADRPSGGPGDGGHLYVPEYATSKVTARPEDQSVSLKAVRRIVIDTARANPAFVARVLNSPLGKAMRQSASHGATIQRIDPRALEEIPIPLPDLRTQDRIVRLHADAAAVDATVADRLRSLDEDWRRLDEVTDDVGRLKGVLDIDRRIEDWWRELPYPLATIYRRHRTSGDPKERFSAILHFFEVFAIYLASLGIGHLRAARPDAAEVVGKLAYTERSSIDRTDFGFWVRLASAAFKELRRTFSDPGLRNASSDHAGLPMIAAMDTITGMSEAPPLLDRPREIRNSTTGHGGLMKPIDAERLNLELQTILRDLFAATAATLRKVTLVRVGRCQMRGDHNVYEAEALQGSDPTFERLSIESRRRADSGSLAMWHPQAGEIVAKLPFFRLGAPQDPAESTVYVYNRVDAGGLRWVSYQEARDQEIVTADDGLDGLIRPRA